MESQKYVYKNYVQSVLPKVNVLMINLTIFHKKLKER